MKAKLKQIWLDFISLIFPRYTLTVSYNDTWGDKDDQEFIEKKFYTKKPNYLKFKKHEGDHVYVRGEEYLLVLLAESNINTK